MVYKLMLNERVIDIDSMNKELNKLNKVGYDFINKAWVRGNDLSFKAYYTITNSKFEITYKMGKAVKLTCMLDPYMREHTTNGMRAWRVAQRFYKVPVLHDKVDAPMVAVQVLYNNPKLKGIWNEAVSYDVNSMFSWGLLQPMPNTAVEPRKGVKLQQGEVGYIMPDIVVYEAGKRVDYAFPLIESPFKKFVDYYYNIKCTTADKVQKQKAKDTMNFFIGYTQRKNSFIRASVIDHCNKRMYDLINKYNDKVIYANTDSIIATGPIDELEQQLGEGVGLWKKDHKGAFAFNGFNYQWKGEKPSIRGKKGHYAPVGYDITKDSSDFDDSSMYYFDEKIHKICKRGVENGKN